MTVGLSGAQLRERSSDCKHLHPQEIVIKVSVDQLEYQVHLREPRPRRNKREVVQCHSFSAALVGA